MGLKRGRKVSLFLLRLSVATVVVGGIMVLGQNFLIFPGAYDIGRTATAPLPEGVESMFINGGDEGVRLNVLRVDVSERRSPLVAAVFHGNAGSARNFLPYNALFWRQGIRSYGFDYRGFGKSSGSVSEEGINKDTIALYDEIRAREGVSYQDIIPVGISIGTGPAAFAVSRFNPKAVVLFSPFSSLRNLVEEMPLVGPLARMGFLWYDFPVVEPLRNSTVPCAIIVHGHRDEVIPFHHGQSVDSSLRSSHDRKVIFIEVPEAGHNDLLLYAQKEIEGRLSECF